MTELERMMRGELYIASDETLVNMRIKANDLLDKFNSTKYKDHEERNKILKELLGKVSENTHIHKPFHCDYGKNIYIGKNFFANYDCVFLDVNKIIIGDNCMFGPKVCLYTAGHPIDKDIRNEEYEFGKPITIGNNCWIGGNVVINPGIKIGNNVVIGSGSVITKDISDNLIVAGNPAKIIREISETDKQYWVEQKQIYLKNK